MSKVGVVFVHGFTGGNKTWRSPAGHSFSDLLMADKELASTYDFFEFEYYTKILDVFDSALVKKLMSLLGLSSGRVKKNKPIAKLSALLTSYIRLELEGYDEVIVIAHSMGGLVAKDYILGREHDDGALPIGYVSIAVPHKGSIGAMALSGININAAELAPLSEYSSDLNNRWIDAKPNLPKSVYIIASHDEVVAEVSAVPFTVPKKQTYTLAHDHTSICKPDSSSDSSYKAVSAFLREVAYERKMKSLSSISYDDQAGNYDKEIFVIKLILADVHTMGVEDAKESFFNAEIISKAANQRDRQILCDLSSRVLSLYRQTYADLDGSLPPNKILARVHELIVNQDSTSLSAGVEYINFLHKKGLLHKMANGLNFKVVWNDCDIEDIRVLM